MNTPKITDGSVIDLMHQFTKEAREAKAAKPAGDGSEPTSFSELDSEDAGTISHSPTPSTCDDSVR